MDTHFLEDIGLTKGEISVYLNLLGMGQTTSGPIIAAAGISSSKVYEILEKLLSKGLVSFIIKNKVKHFSATSPAKLREYLLQKEHEVQAHRQELERRLPELFSRFQSQQTIQNAAIFVGLAGIKTMLWDMIEDARKNESYLFFGGNELGYTDAIRRLYFQYSLKRHEKGLRVRGISNIAYRSLSLRAPHATMRFIDYPTPSNMSIFRDYVAIVSWSEPPTAVLIRSENTAEQFRNFFESVWKSTDKKRNSKKCICLASLETISENRRA